MITVQLQSKMHGWNEWLACSALLSNAHAAATAVVPQHAADWCMITVQPQSKMHGWNEWLAWLCLFSNAHMQQRTAVVPQHAADCVHDNCTATIKDVQLE
jgi:hypothetical protein